MPYSGEAAAAYFGLRLSRRPHLHRPFCTPRAARAASLYRVLEIVFTIGKVQPRIS